MDTIKKCLILIALIVSSLAFTQSANAIWWNPTTWFTSDNSQNVSNTELLQKISDLENKIKDQPPVNQSNGTTTSDTDLQGQLNKVVADNNSLKSKLINVQRELNDIQDKYAVCQSNLTSGHKNAEITDAVSQPTPISTPTPTPTTVIQRDTPFSYDKYVKVNVSDYVKNPSEYRGWGTAILTATVDDFLGAGDRGVTNNYIEITDAHANSLTPSKMMIQFDNSTDYAKAIYSLSTGDLIDVWGVGFPSQMFRSVGSTDSSSSYEPVLEVQRIDKCSSSNCASGTVIFVRDNSEAVSISDMWQNPGIYTNKLLNTKGKVVQIMNSPNGGKSLVMMQDQDQNSGMVSFEMDAVSLASDQVKVGSILQITGTLLSFSDPASNAIETLYQLANPDGSYYIINGTVTVSY